MTEPPSWDDLFAPKPWTTERVESLLQSKSIRLCPEWYPSGNWEKLVRGVQISLTGIVASTRRRDQIREIVARQMAALRLQIPSGGNANRAFLEVAMKIDPNLAVAEYSRRERSKLFSAIRKGNAKGVAEGKLNLLKVRNWETGIDE